MIQWSWTQVASCHINVVQYRSAAAVQSCLKYGTTKNKKQIQHQIIAYTRFSNYCILFFFIFYLHVTECNPIFIFWPTSDSY